MRDSSEEMKQMQRQIMLKMSAQQRFQQGIDMIKSARKIAENSVKAAHPDATEAEIQVLLFQRYYGHELPAEDVQYCSEQLLKYWQARGSKP